MRKITTYIFALSLALLTFTGCKKDDAPAEVFAAGQGKITGTNGLSFNVSGANAVFNRQPIGNIDGISIMAIISTAPVKMMTISLVDITAPGTYSLDPASSTDLAQVSYVAGSGSSDTYASSISTTSHGTVTVTAISATSIEGTYTTKVSNLAGASISFSGTFKGNF